ncbi:hypothetical protein R1sor_005343 [Riccia sorocarpa]|uniref:CCHC-type domain-containing protein n=1 Tax=Riccia sorocarpa TaxID=122646 RepID=A0ABD3HMR7_9MARC
MKEGSPVADERHYFPSDIDVDSEDLESDQEATETRRRRNRWLLDLKDEIKAAFTKLPERTGKTDPSKAEVEVVHKLNLSAQVRTANTKRRLEERGVVFCTVDISSSRDAFCTWLQQESAGTTLRYESKFANVRGCVLMNMTQPLPAVLTVQLGSDTKRIEIQYNVLSDSCFQCHERGHIARVCPLTTTITTVHPKPAQKDNDAGFTEVAKKDHSRSSNPKPQDKQHTPVIIYEVLGSEDEETAEKDPQDTNHNQTGIAEVTPMAQTEAGDADVDLNLPSSSGNPGEAEETSTSGVPSTNNPHQVRDHIIEQNRLERKRKRRGKKKKREQRGRNEQRGLNRTLKKGPKPIRRQRSFTKPSLADQERKKKRGQTETMDAELTRVENLANPGTEDIQSTKK